MSDTGEEPAIDLPLAGYTVAVTAARRKEELGALLDRRGARVVYAPAIRIVPLADDSELLAATGRVLTAPVDLVVATTAVGFRGWLEAADAWDLPLVQHLSGSRVLARGPKARGAVRSAGLVDAWSPESESSAGVLEHLLSGTEGPLEGRRVAVQLHGDPLRELVAGLRDAGAEVLPVPVYRWLPPEDVAPLHRLVGMVVAGEVDAVTFTSAPAAASLLRTAEDLGQRAALVAAFDGRVLAVAVGTVTGGPLEAAGIPYAHPERGRLGPLAVRSSRGCPAGTRCCGSVRTPSRCAATPPSSTGTWWNSPPDRWPCCASWPGSPAGSSPGPTSAPRGPAATATSSIRR
ncbi:uroporphyrinogen-III synthase [Blastococcus saxobsidens]|uniref:Uroporphyrinogen-III synthase n=1 Tax=Blastococcus saxobsidens (strain DD2) TaxID=1146883 RepID=H6RWB3_BLASD|nr:uroporphyrinogen-III synthase [Blastococcus saxobsidens]CCG03328.1 Uroporphyrinogen-III synthase [Blastococcus saxobsidens DD2]